MRHPALRLFLFVVAAAGTLPPSAWPQMTIRAGSLRVASFDDAGRCAGALSSPVVLNDTSPAIPGRDWVLYGQGGVVTEPGCGTADLMNPDRFGDRVWFAVRGSDGRWHAPDGGGPEPVVSRTSFPWMSDRDYLVAHPEAFVGHLASPTVAKIGNRYFMAFVASLDDRNLCAGEHMVANPCGSCVDPWSYFVLMWAVSDDGEHWRVRTSNHAATRLNRALDSALVWATPHRWDMEGKTSFKGLARVSMIAREEDGGQYFYLASVLWGSWRTKNVMLRIKHDPASEWGFSDDPQIWDTHAFAWESCYRGELPGWLNDPHPRGELFGGSFSSISESSLTADYRYIAVLSSSSLASKNSSSRGLSNQIAYRLSKDLLRWSSVQVVTSLVPFVADGTGYDASVLEPFYVEGSDGLYHFFFASADGGPESPPDGSHDCGMSSTPDFPTGPYIGAGVYEGVGWKSRRARIPRR